MQLATCSVSWNATRRAEGSVGVCPGAWALVSTRVVRRNSCQLRPPALSSNGLGVSNSLCIGYFWRAASRIFHLSDVASSTQRPLTMDGRVGVCARGLKLTKRLFWPPRVPSRALRRPPLAWIYLLFLIYERRHFMVFYPVGCPTGLVRLHWFGLSCRAPLWLRWARTKALKHYGASWRTAWPTTTPSITSRRS